MFSLLNDDTYINCRIRVRPRVLDDLPVVTRSEAALSRAEWESFFDDDGRMNYETGFREAVFGKGVEHDIRAEVWKFLLGYFDASLTHDERAKIRSERVRELCTFHFMDNLYPW